MYNALVKIDCSTEGLEFHDFIVGRNAILTLENLGRSKEAKFVFSALGKNLYKFLPFAVEILVDGRAEAVFEVSAEWQRHEVTLPLPVWHTGSVEIQIACEQGGRPCDLGIGPDVRDTALRLERVTCTEERTIPQRSGFHQRRVFRSNWPLPDDQRPAPIFVIGAYRSMTSITTWALGQHPNIGAVEETNWLNMLYLGARAAFAQSEKPQDSPAQAYNIRTEDFLRLQGWTIDRAYRELIEQRAHNVETARLANMDPDYDPNFALRLSPRSAKRRWVDGTPENTGMAIGLATMFPDAQFVFMVRSPADVVRSLMGHARAGGIDRSVEEAIDIWETMSQYGYEALEALGSSRVRLSLSEEVAEAPDATLSKLFAFLDEPQYPQASRVFTQKINSSGTVADWDESRIDGQEMARLNRIYQGMRITLPLESLPWKKKLWPFEERQTHFAAGLRAAIS